MVIKGKMKKSYGDGIALALGHGGEVINLHL